MSTQHDKIFKQLLRTFLPDFLRLATPEMLDRLDLSAPEFLDKELFVEGPQGRRRELDLLVRVRFSDGRPLLIHVEIEARARRGMADRLWRYHNQIQARHETPVLAFVIYLQRGRPGICQEVWENGLGPAFPEFRYVAFGLAGCRAADFLARPEPLAWAFAALMDPGSWSRAELKIACLRRIANAKGRIDTLLLANCVETYLELPGDEATEFEALCSRKEDKEMRASSLTWAEKMEAKGRGEGAREILVDLLSERFGPLSKDTRSRIEEIDSIGRLRQIAKRLLKAGSLEEMGLA